jgi:diguanylate cyclase (GGDEF)-like protein/PAS domain S-box-containing protein
MGAEGDAPTPGRSTSAQRFEFAWATSLLGMGIVDAGGRWMRVNDALCELSGRRERELLQSSLGDLVDSEPGGAVIAERLANDAAAPRAHQAGFTRANGERGSALVSVSRIPPASSAASAPEFAVQIQDVSDLVQLSEQVAGLAPPDALTGLPSRRVFMRDLASQVGRCQRYGEKSSLLVVDVDDFEQLNASHGREAGDAVLVAVADALRKRLRRSDVLARVGADEFAVLLPVNGHGPEVAQALAETVAGLEVPLRGDVLQVTATTGARSIDGKTLSGEVELGELESLTLKAQPSVDAVGAPSSASVSSAGLRATHRLRRQLGIAAVAVAATGGVVYGVTTLVGRRAAVRPRPAPASVLRVVGHDVAVTQSGHFAVQLKCGGAPCGGVLALTSTVPSTSTRRARTLIVARTRFLIAPAGTSAVPGQLVAVGRRLFASDNGRVAAAMTATLVNGTTYSPALAMHLIRASASRRVPAAPGFSPSTPSSATIKGGTLPAPVTPGAGGSASGPGTNVSGTSCTGGDQLPTPASTSDNDTTTLCLINAQRLQAGLQPLRENAELDQAAAGHNNDMIARDYFAHISPSGETPLDWIVSSGYVLSNSGYIVGENIAWGTLSLSTPQAIVNAWMNSPDHRANILNPAFRDTGMAVAAEVPPSLAFGQQGALYTQNFAGPLG